MEDYKETLTFNSIEERNEVSWAIFKELVSLKTRILDAVVANEACDGNIEEYNTLFAVYKRLLGDMPQWRLDEYEQSIRVKATERLQKKIFV